jgi:Signal peptidase (SPase) II
MVDRPLLSRSVTTVLQVLNSGQRRPTLTINNDLIPWTSPQSTLQQLFQNRSEKVVVVKQMAYCHLPRSCMRSICAVRRERTSFWSPDNRGVQTALIERRLHEAALAGSGSNLYDRLRHGAVIDFLDLGWWPASNLADIAIVLGVIVSLRFL